MILMFCCLLGHGRDMRHVVIAGWPAAAVLALAGCGPTPKPFEHDDDDDAVPPAASDKAEVAVAAPANMPPQMGQRVAAALAMELQSYGIVAAVQPATAPLRSPAP